MLSRKEQRFKLIRKTSAVLLLVYLAFISWRLFFFAYANYRRVQNSMLGYNLIPFRTIFSLLGNYDKYNFTFLIYNLLGNIVIFIPLGALLTLMIKRCSVKITIGTSFLIILLAESMQSVTRVGVFDVDDIILNLSGCFLGYLIGSILRKHIYTDKK